MIFESEVRAMETLHNIPPENWTSIEYKSIENTALFIWLLIFAGIAFIIFRAVRKSGPSVSFKMFDPSEMVHGVFGSKLSVLEPGHKKLNIKFKDVAGLHEAKTEIREFVDYLKNPQKYTKLGAKLPKGALLTGPPGCGKTLLARALAAESTVPFISINGTEFVEMIGGLGASRMRKLFEMARSKSPCIVYIDEIDAIGRKRSNKDSLMDGGHSEFEQTLNQLLVEMDGVDSAKGIIMIASTNRPDVLDKALLRPGRFDRHISVDLPTILEREELFKLYLKKIKIHRLTDDLSKRLAQLTPKFSGADIANVVNEGAMIAANHKKKFVYREDLHAALEKVLAGPEKRSRVLQDEERHIVAYHEAGHCLVGWYLKHTDALLKKFSVFWCWDLVPSLALPLYTIM
uniref:AAA+ ATPase domain-containing protein n=1 Tax=Acrobeloides nanus TaxID=290746 RepID=A0A914D4U1_9BILA